jgi:hypothetical protein
MAKIRVMNDPDLAYADEAGGSSGMKLDESVLDLMAPPVQKAGTDLAVVDITPDVSLIRKSGQTGYKAHESIAELVDNPLDERLPSEKVRIDIFINRDKKVGGRITVVDNAAGMDQGKLQNAMVMARSSKTSDKIGMFGMGMKTGASNLGSRFTIETTTKDMKYGLQMTYDETAFLKANEWKMVIKKIAKPFDHGTRIDITGIRVSLYPELVNVVRGRLARYFKHFIKNNLAEIFVNGLPVEPVEPKLVEGYTKHFEFAVNGKNVRGWAGIRATGSQIGRYGFDLVRNNRIVSQHNKLGFNPHPALSWIDGELFLDQFEVTSNKRDFVHDTDDWKALEKRLREELKEVVRNSRKRANNQLPKREDEAAKGFAEEMSELMESSPMRADVRLRMLNNETSATTAADQEAKKPTRGKDRKGTSDTEDNVIPLNPGKPYNRVEAVVAELVGVKVIHQAGKLGAYAPYFVSESDERADGTTIRVMTNLDHPVYRNITDFDMSTRVKDNMVEACAKYLCEKENVDSIEDFIAHKSMILKRHAQIKLKLEDVEDLDPVDAIFGE